MSETGLALRVAVVLCASGLMTGCAPFLINWYVNTDLQTSKGAIESGGVLVAVANRSKEMCSVERIVLNPDSEGNGFAWFPKVGAGSLNMQPGAVIVIPISSFASGGRAAACSLPVRLAIHGSCTWQFPRPGDPILTVAEAMPTYLPDAWRGCPVSP